MSQKVEFKFAIGQVVEHGALGIQGSVVALMVDRSAVQWALIERASHDAKEIISDWMREEELRETQEKQI